MSKYNGRTVEITPEAFVPEMPPRQTPDTVLQAKMGELERQLRTLRAARLLAKIEASGVDLRDVQAALDSARLD